MTFMDWMQTVPREFTEDPVWNVEAYRLALFAGDIGWKDVTKLVQDNRTRRTAAQLYNAIGSIAANISEGYSRRSGKDKARFYEYSLGSARESRTWYFNARHLLGNEIVGHRFQLLSSIAKLLTVMIPDQRTSSLREDDTEYHGTKSVEFDLPAFIAAPVPFC